MFLSPCSCDHVSTVLPRQSWEKKMIITSFGVTMRDERLALEPDYAIPSRVVFKVLACPKTLLIITEGSFLIGRGLEKYLQYYTPFISNCAHF